MRDVLKAHKFRWHKNKGIWYGKGELSEIASTLQQAYDAAKTETSTTAKEVKNNAREEAVEVEGRADEGTEGSHAGTRKEESDGRGVPEALGGVQEKVETLWERH